MKIGEIKEINNKGLSFKVKKIDEAFLNVETGEKFSSIGIVITVVPENKYGVKKGSKIALSN